MHNSKISKIIAKFQLTIVNIITLYHSIDFEEICDDSNEFYEVLQKHAKRRQAERQKLITVKIHQAMMNKGEKAIRHRHSLIEF